ncbi:hypothetical protein WAF17_19835 [Bernardetia sp. ABR2-2B]|uniref:hypothetical protein n=1 Tax=Bernardetia sp. ABR2-2B TaxID=3127472 RepID=UPI0030CA802D
MKKNKFLIIIFAFSLLIEVNSSFAQSLNDQEQVEKYLEQLNNQKFDEEDFGEDYEEKYYEGKVIYSPDSLFKIFTFSGDAYFAYFTSISKSYIHILNSEGQTKKVIEEINFDGIIGIYKLSESNYLVLEKRENKVSSVNYVSYMMASWLVLDIENGSIDFKQIDIEKDEQKLTYSTQEYNLDYTLQADIFYSTQNNQLVFEYSIIEEDNQEPLHFIRVTYEWKNDFFILMREEKRAYKK